jgi:hypothetical protein
MKDVQRITRPSQAHNLTNLTFTMQEWTILVCALLGALATVPDRRFFLEPASPPDGAPSSSPSASGAGIGGVSSVMSASLSLPSSLILGGFCGCNHVVLQRSSSREWRRMLLRILLLAADCSSLPQGGATQQRNARTLGQKDRRTDSAKFGEKTALRAVARPLRRGRLVVCVLCTFEHVLHVRTGS